jgi:hypothetical protein
VQRRGKAPRSARTRGKPGTQRPGVATGSRLPVG